MRTLLMNFLLILSPIVSADMDKVCTIYTQNFGWNDIAKGIKEKGCVRNNILQVVYGMENPEEGIWVAFYENGEPLDNLTGIFKKGVKISD